MRVAEEFRQQSRAAADVDVVALLRLPGVIAGLSAAVPEAEEEQERLGQALDACLREALPSWTICATPKAGTWSKSCARAWRALASRRNRCANWRPLFGPHLRGACETRLKELLGGTAIDPARLAQEAALLAERSDISEELDRLRSHLQQFAKLLDGAGELGKKLDFLLQEMHREANTLLLENARRGELKRWPSPGWRWKSRRRSKNCASRCRTSNEHAE